MMQSIRLGFLPQEPIELMLTAHCAHRKQAE
jgi:hypothetical protein